MSSDVRFDRYGRMQYHPEYHSKQGTPWTVADQKYLIENYVGLGPEQVSMALERTIGTIMTRANKLRKDGLMAPALSRKSTHKRLLRKSIKETNDASSANN